MGGREVGKEGGREGVMEGEEGGRTGEQGGAPGGDGHMERREGQPLSNKRTVVTALRKIPKHSYAGLHSIGCNL